MRAGSYRFGMKCRVSRCRPRHNAADEFRPPAVHVEIIEPMILLDGQLQAYNFRFMMTQVATNRVAPFPPPGYRREDFHGVLPVLESGRIKRVFGYPSDCIFKAETALCPAGFAFRRTAPCSCSPTPAQLRRNRS